MSAATDSFARERREAARPRLLAWLRVVEAKVRTKELKDLDYRLAVVLTNYPSANEGKCWAGQKRLADQMGRSERTIREAVGRLESGGFLTTRRRGQGRTSCYTLTIDRRAILGEAERVASAAQDQQPTAGQDRQQVAAKPSERKPTEQESSPPTPSGQGEVIDLVAERSERKKQNAACREFLNNCHRVDGCLDGPALVAWSKLSPHDRQAIWEIIKRDGFIDLKGLWACTWLKLRMWENYKPWNTSDVPLGPSLLETRFRVFVEVGSPQWERWTRHYLQHGGFHGLRIKPPCYTSGNGRQGWYFPSAEPPQ